LYYQFSLSYRVAKDLLTDRGIDVSHEAVGRRALKFGQDCAQKLR
jgi:transposase-like protein